MTATFQPVAPAISIRHATVDDVPILLKAIVALAEHADDADEVACTEDDLRRFGFGENPAFEAIVAEVGGTFAGMCLFFPIFSSWFGRPGVFVQDLFVEERYRGLGLGERLLRHVAGLSRDRGGVYMRLSVDENNGRARDFYERLGLAWSHDQRSYIASGQIFAALGETGGARK
ncbi:GNAT family N-acetyltransferase [Mesorhizobium sp. ANAO-SY3R2]|uniref:GNAT family N-acetyltransferase n=1 Tax=Mesorhizobium sp. ANAO-SY3R2 TaxID=3166644 RepID=UPI0036704657